MISRDGARRVSVLTAVAVVLGMLGAVAAASAKTVEPGRLRVVISGLPARVSADVRLRGPHGFHRTVRASRRIAAPAGRYVVTVRSVRIARSHGRIRAGSVAFAERLRFRVRVRPGRLRIVQATYGTIRDPRVKRLSRIPTVFSGTPLAPTMLVIPFAGHPHVGAILTRAPSPTLPGGLFVRVTRVSKSGANAALSVVPASLADAYPEMSVSASVSLHPLPVHGAGDATAAGFSPLDFSYGNEFFRCGVPITTGYEFSTHSSFSADATIDLHFPLFHQPHGTLSVTLGGSAALSFTLPAGLHCDGTTNLPPLVGVVLGIPVYMEVGVAGSVQVAQDWSVAASGDLKLTAGVSFKGLHFTPIFTLRPHGTASTSGAGKISIGPNLRLAVGVPDGADVHLDLNPADSFTVGSGVCLFAVDDNVQAGVSFGPFEINEPATIASLPVYNCSGGTGASVTVSNPGNQTSEAGTAVSLQMQATDATGRKLSYGSSSLPAGLSINSATGLISGTPTTPGTSSVTIAATDSGGAQDAASFSWTIRPHTIYAVGDIMASMGAGQVGEFAPNGTLVRTLDTGTNSQVTGGSAFDESGNFYVTDFDASTVSKFDANGNLVGTFGSGYTEAPESITINPTGDVFVGQANPESSTGSCIDCNVLEFDPAGNQIGNFAPAVENRGTDWVALGPDGCTLYYTSEGTSVMRFDICTNQQLSDFADNLPGSFAYELRLLPDGGMLVADTESVIRLDASGNITQQYEDPAETNLFSMDLTPDGSAFWAGDLTTGDITEWAIDSGDELTQFNAAPASGVGGLTVVGSAGSALAAARTRKSAATGSLRAQRRPRIRRRRPKLPFPPGLNVSAAERTLEYHAGGR